LRDAELADLLVAVLRDTAHALTVDKLVDAAAHRLLSAEQVRRVVGEDTRFTCTPNDGVTLKSRAALKTELDGLLNAERSPRNRAIITSYLGWDGGKRFTLEQLGREYGLTRERIRQICVRFTKRLPAVTTPVLDRCLEIAAAAGPSHAVEVESTLTAAGDLPTSMSLSDLLCIAEQFGRPTGFTVVESGTTRLVVAPDTDRLIPEIQQAARRAVEHWGVATIEEVVAKVAPSVKPELVARVLASSPGFGWLDEAGGWFWLSTRRNRLLNHVRKVLAVATQGLAVAALRDAVRRHYRWQGVAPPRRVLLEVCRRTAGLEVQRDVVRAKPPLHTARELSPTEQTLVQILLQHGGVMARLPFQDACVAAGMNRSTFMVYLDYSPVLVKYARGVYGLVGHNPPPGMVASLAPKGQPGRRLLDVGWMTDGRPWCAYRLGRNTLESGVVGVPSGLKTIFAGEFRLEADDGTPMGTLVARNSSAWGLGPFFRRRGGEEDDCLLLVLDVANRKAVVAIGDDGMVELARSGRFKAQQPIVDLERATPDRSRAAPGDGMERAEPVLLSANDINVMPVPGKEKSQVEVRVADLPGWRAVAYDNGHRKGFRIEIFGAGDTESEIVRTAPGVKRAEAVELAIQQLRSKSPQTERLAG
jgi:hypothetical protein